VQEADMLEPAKLLNVAPAHAVQTKDVLAPTSVE
jgi:hypothetical protein